MYNLRPELSQLKTSCQEKKFSESVTTSFSDVGAFKELYARLYRRTASDFISAFCD